MRPLILFLFFGLVLIGSTLQPEPASADYASLHPKASVKVLQSQKKPVVRARQSDIPQLLQKADAGDMAAKVLVGRWYFVGGENFLASRYLREPAENGNPEAQYLYAQTVMDISKGKENPAFAWLERAADGNYIPAMMQLADLYLSESYRGKCITILRKAASLGEARAAHTLGKLLLDGTWLSHDGVAAYTWLYLARHGFSDPYTRPRSERGSKYTGFLPPLDFLAWTMSLSEIRQVEAALAAWPETLPPPETPFYHYTGWMQKLDRRPDSIALTDREIAAVKRKADAGDLDAMARLGHMYSLGLGVKWSREKAEALLQKAGDQGSTQAVLTLAGMYDYTKAGAPKARALYESLAAKGVPEAQVGLASLLLNKKLFPERSEEAFEADRQTAIGYLRQAVKTGDRLAMYWLGKALQKDDPQEAARWFEQGAALGHDLSLFQRIELAEQAADWEAAYLWLSVWMPIERPSYRAVIRYRMLKLLPFLKDDVLDLKTRADTWLQEHPKALDHSWLRPEDGVDQSDHGGATALHRAAMLDDTDEAARLIAAGATVNVMDLEGQTPLYYAVERGHFPMVKLLVEAGAAVNAKGGLDSYSSLFRAVYRGDEDMVAYLLHAGADPAATPRLWIAVDDKKTTIVRMLVEAGYDVNDITSYDGKSVLHLAARKGGEEILQILLQAKANPNVRDEDGNTPLHDAVTENNPAAVTLLLAAKADSTATNNDGKTPLDLAESHEVKQLLKAAGDGKPKGK